MASDHPLPFASLCFESSIPLGAGPLLGEAAIGQRDGLDVEVKAEMTSDSGGSLSQLGRSRSAVIDMDRPGRSPSVGDEKGKTGRIGPTGERHYQASVGKIEHRVETRDQFV